MIIGKGKFYINYLRHQLPYIENKRNKWDNIMKTLILTVINPIEGRSHLWPEGFIIMRQKVNKVN